MGESSIALTSTDIQRFILDGFIKIDNAFSRQLADEGRSILWKDTGCDPKDPLTWKQPVVRLGDYSQKPFREAANTPVLCNAFDQLVGKNKWVPRTSLGTFPVRFPSHKDPGDDGWHVDAGFPGEDPSDFIKWRVNIKSRGRALLMLFLFSDVGENDAPTRIRVGSHLEVAKILEPAGDDGLSFKELADEIITTSELPQVLATGKAGTVYLCHPFIVHAAQPHRGKVPRFMAQPPLYPVPQHKLERRKINRYFPLEKAIRLAIGYEQSYGTNP